MWCLLQADAQHYLCYDTNRSQTVKKTIYCINRLTFSDHWTLIIHVTKNKYKTMVKRCKHNNSTGYNYFCSADDKWLANIYQNSITTVQSQTNTVVSVILYSFPENKFPLYGYPNCWIFFFTLIINKWTETVLFIVVTSWLVYSSHMMKLYNLVNWNMTEMWLNWLLLCYSVTIPVLSVNIRLTKRSELHPVSFAFIKLRMF